MSLRFLMDVHVRRAVTDGLRARGVDVLTAQEDASSRLSDPELLDRATLLGRVLISSDDDLLIEATRRQRSGEPFGGIIFFAQAVPAISERVEDLELLAEVYDTEEFLNRVEFLPLI